MAKISIIGCGWLGFPLAVRLKSLGNEVSGTTTHEFKLLAMQRAGIRAFLFNPLEELSEAELPVFNCETAIVTIPPLSKLGEEVSLSIHQKIADLLQCKHLIYTSSTSVYPDDEQIMTEDYRVPDSLQHSLEHIYNSRFTDCTIVRFGGLVGPNRHPGRFLAGKKGLPKPHAPVNITGLQDALNALEFLQGNKSGGIFNVVSPLHPTRVEFYTAMSERLGLEPPEFNKDDQTRGKTISSQKMMQQADFHFALEDPMQYSN